MKLLTKADVTVLAIEKKEASGQYGESYKIAIMQGSEVGTYSCTKDVYESLNGRPLMKPYPVAVQIGEFKGDTTVRVTGVTVPDEPRR